MMSLSRMKMCCVVLLGCLGLGVLSGCGQGVESDAEPPDAEQTSSTTVSTDLSEEADDLWSLPSTDEQRGETLATVATDEQDVAACNALTDANQALLHAPCGSYAATCSGGAAWGIYGDRFCADCKAKDGSTKRTCINKGECNEWSVWNDDGTLRCATKPVVARVTTAAQLVAALGSASKCTRVEVASNATIDLTTAVWSKNLRIPAGVTLAGGPDGSATRPLLTITRFDPVRAKAQNVAMFEAGGPDVRLTGLRLRGPDTTRSRYRKPACAGVQSIGYHGLQVDHSELSGWPFAAIYVKQSRYAYVHGNDSIHHNRQDGLGYGVCLDVGSSALIDGNTFNANRHAVAGTGDPNVLYLARNNKVGAERTGQVFDMHGVYERSSPQYWHKPWAGCLVELSNNTVAGTTAQAALIRGIPASARGVEIHDNCFAYATPAAAAKQWLRTDKGQVNWATYTAKYPDRHWHVGTNTYSCSR